MAQPFLSGYAERMTAPNITAARRFVELATVADTPALAALAQSLDELAIAYYDTSPGIPVEYAPNPPKSTITYAQIGSRFPDLGYYGAALPGDLTGSASVGDAIDDILDIASDLSEIIWRFDHIGSDDADWHYRLLFQCHWGRHLRDLSRYLHAKQFD